MVRRSPRRAQPPRPSPASALIRVEPGPGGEPHRVRPIAGARAVKVYRCPGCDQEIRVGIAHLVVWPAADGDERGVADRRHWHSGCWANRATRGPTRRWS